MYLDSQYIPFALKRIEGSCIHAVKVFHSLGFAHWWHRNSTLEPAPVRSHRGRDADEPEDAQMRTILPSSYVGGARHVHEIFRTLNHISISCEETIKQVGLDFT